MIYLDHSATTPPLEEALAAYTRAAREDYFNPSSLYAPAMRGQEALRGAKEAVLKTLGATGREVFWTSGGTEADNLAVLGAARALRGRRGRFLYGAGEHPAVAEAMAAVAAMGHEVLAIPLDARGVATREALEPLLAPDTALVSVQHVNNETGAIQPVEELARLLHERCPRALFHTDAVQGFLRVPICLEEVDLYTLSGHKIHAPRGVGALVTRKKPGILPIAHGGGQQGGLRSGTEDVPGVAGLRAAVEWFAGQGDLSGGLMRLKTRLYEGIMAALPDARLNGPPPEEGAPHILNMSFGVPSEVLLHALEGEGILVSAGSACSSHKRKPSAVLTAMHVPAEAIQGAIRLSLSPMNTRDEMDETIRALARLVPDLRKYRRK